MKWESQRQCQHERSGLQVATLPTEAGEVPGMKAGLCASNTHTRTHTATECFVLPHISIPLPIHPTQPSRRRAHVHISKGGKRLWSWRRATPQPSSHSYANERRGLWGGFFSSLSKARFSHVASRRGTVGGGWKRRRKCERQREKTGYRVRVAEEELRVDEKNLTEKWIYKSRKDEHCLRQYVDGCKSKCLNDVTIFFIPFHPTNILLIFFYYLFSFT